MTLLSWFKMQRSYWRGQRPQVDDMEQVVTYMRRRRERGLPALPFVFGGRSRGVGPRDPERVRVGQLAQLRRTVEHVYRYVPYYREAMDAIGVKPEDIRTLADVQKLPITHREQLCDNTEAFISRHPGAGPTTPSATSGTTGRRLTVYLTTDELRSHIASTALNWLLTGTLGPSDIVQMHRTQDGSTAALVLTTAARLAGALVFTRGLGGTLDEHVKSIFEERHIPGKKHKVSVIDVYPTHLWALTRRAEEMGFDFREAGLEQIRVAGAPVSEELKQRVMDTWGITLREGYGLNEVGTCGAHQCTASDRLHFTDHAGYAEVLDAETAEPVPPGQPGVLTITSFYPGRELMPLLRYWTQDLVIVSPDPICVCGVAITQIIDILGRADDVVIVSGAKFYPQRIGDSLLPFPELVMPPRFALRSEQREDAQYAILDVEMTGTLSEQGKQELQERIADALFLSRLSEVRLGSVKVVVNLRSVGSIEQPSPYKIRDGVGQPAWVRHSSGATRDVA